MLQKPLDGLKVLDLSRVLAGPYCTMLLADMGADVVKVEQPGKGDDTRGYGPPFLNGESTYFMSINRNKRSLTLNLKHAQGKGILRQMIQKADVLVENFRPGKMAELGFAYEQTNALNPRLVYCSVSGYGQTGPLSHNPGYDLIIQGEGGIASLTGDPDGPPYKVGTSQADIVAGMNAFQGILLALLARARTGRGQHVDVALLDCQISLLTYQAGIYFATGVSPTRMGNQHPSIAPYETYRCRDGYVNIACGNDRIWAEFCKAVGLAALLEDARFRTNADRVHNRAALGALLEPVIRQRTAQEWVDLLRPAGVPCGKIQSVEEVCEHPQTKSREMVVELDHPVAGPIRVTGIPIKLSATPGAVSTPPPVLGEHTAQVLAAWLGLDQQQVAQLRADGVV